MIFISLLLYLTLVLVFYLASLAFLFSFTWYYFAGIFLVCLILTRISFSVIRDFQNELVPDILDIQRTSGLKSVIFLTAVFSFALIAFFTTNKELGLIFGAVLVPVALVYTLNVLGIEYLPAFFREFQVDSKWVLPTRFFIDENDDRLVITPDPNEEKEDNTPKELFRKRFQWVFKETSFQTELEIRPAIYQKYKEEKRVDYSYWAEEYVANGICEEVLSLARQLMQIGKPQNSFEEVEFVLGFIQEIVKYERDAEYYPNAIIPGEYPKYPIETLVEETGDCEDSSILGAALLKCMGYDSALIFLPGHCALGIAGVEGMPGTYVEHNQNYYYYCETTASGWKFGILPEEYKKSVATVYPIPARKVSLGIPS